MEYRLCYRYLKYLNYIFNVSRVEYLRSEEFSIECRKDWRLIEIEAGDSLVTIFNQYKELPIEEYNIDYSYYIEEVNKIIDTITGEKERRLLEQKQIKEREYTERIELREREEREKREKREAEQRKRERENYIQFCINREPTIRMYELYKRNWFIEEFGEPKGFKKSPVRKSKEEGVDENEIATSA